MFVYHGSDIEIRSSGKRSYIEQLQYSKPNNQFCIASYKGISSLTFCDNYKPEV